MSAVPADHKLNLNVSAREAGGSRILAVEGSLDSTTYLPLRDAIIKAAIDGPGAVIVDVSKLAIPAPTALAVFTSARWHIVQWPHVPILLVCSGADGRETIVRSGVARYVPVYAMLTEAVAAQLDWLRTPVRRRFGADLPRTSASASRSRELVSQWLTAWTRPDLITVAKLVATVFIENVLAHTEGTLRLRLESQGEMVTVAVDDHSSQPAIRREPLGQGGGDVSGLSIVAPLCRAWGNSPTPSGKTVWAALGPEKRLGE